MGMQQMMMAAQAGGTVTPANIQLIGVWEKNISSSCDFPTGVQAGDLLIAFYSGGTSNAPPNDGFTWNRVAGFDNTKTNGVFEFYWRWATASTPTRFSRTYSNQWYMVAAYRGVHPSDPIDTYNRTAEGNASNRMVMVGDTTTHNKAKVIAVFDADQAGVTVNAVPSGMTQRSYSGGTSPGDTIAGFDVDQATAGATGDKTAVINTFATYVGVVIALRNATTT